MGKLVPRMGKYANTTAVGNLVRYMTRSKVKENKAGDLISYGGCGIYGNMLPKELIKRLLKVQKTFEINRREGRRVYHEMFNLSDADSQMINPYIIDDFAYECCQEYYRMGFQSVYAIHYKDERFHIHFAISTINFINGNKFQSWKADVSYREALYNEIMKKYYWMNPICYQGVIIPLFNPICYQEIMPPLINPIQYG